MTSHSVFAAQMAIGLVAGMLAGWIHFTGLRWNVRLLIAGAPGRAIGLQLARLGVLAVVFVVLARLGPWPLLGGAAGLLLARHWVVQRVRVQP
ncbi:N-ATPase subunit AtpR [Paraburkholderia caffeinilytica]|uniref:N-ATPase subunit AtpR n=1 Tax=Paraburkholderia caffeinilytica TaxID=1761016 RepID=UPI0038BCBB8C